MKESPAQSSQVCGMYLQPQPSGVWGWGVERRMAWQPGPHRVLGQRGLHGNILSHFTPQKETFAFIIVNYYKTKASRSCQQFKQIGKQIGSQVSRQTDRQAGRQVDVYVHIYIHIWRYLCNYQLKLTMSLERRKLEQSNWVYQLFSVAIKH